MTTIDSTRTKISTEIGGTGRSALIVEGIDDKKAFEVLLTRRDPEWNSRWILAEAGNKSAALKIATLEPSWQVVVDRDEWPDALVDEHRAKHANLFVLPRFCMESYLVDPDELWQAFPAKQRGRPGVSLEVLKTRLFANLDEWRRHAALWRVINPLWSGLRALGFKEELLKTQPIADLSTVQSTLGDWDAYIDADRIWAELTSEQAAIAKQLLGEFLRHTLYAKNFYPQVVHPVLDGLLGTQSQKNRRVDLFKTLPMPSDLEPLWSRMNLKAAVMVASGVEEE